MANLPKVPENPILDKSGNLDIAWRLWFLNPSVTQITTGTAIGTSSGGTGSIATPGIGQVLVGASGGVYAPASTLPVAAFPALSGDISTPAGSTTTTLATVLGSPGTYGTGTTVPAVTVNAKGLVTGAAAQNITGSPGSFTAVGAFGCNSKAAQTSAASGGAVVATASTNVAPWGYSTQAQADAIVTLVNNIRAALVANGIMS